MKLKTRGRVFEEVMNDDNIDMSEKMDECWKRERKEAIKWIKEMRDCCDDCRFLLRIRNKHPFCWRCKFWMNIFNLTDEDLNEVEDK